MFPTNQDLLKKELEKLHHEHFELDRKITRISLENHFDRLALQRLKKEKLTLKDRIEQLRSKLLPDITA